MDFDISKIINPIFFQILGTLILLTIIAKFTYKNFLNILDKREKNINDNISNASLANQEAQEKLQNINKKEKEMLQEKEAIINKAEAIAKEKETKILFDANENAKQIIEKANQEVSNNRKKVEDELMANVMEYVSLVSKEYVKNNIDSEKEQSLINEAIAKVRCE